MKKTNKELYDFLYTNFIEAVTTGKPSGADVVWNSQPGFQRTSTPQSKAPFDKFVKTLQESPNDYLIQLHKAITQEARVRGLVLEPKAEPIPAPERSTIDHEELGKTLAKCNQDCLAEIITIGLLKTTPPKLHPFSGEQLREDVPYEQWEYEVKKALQSHTEKSVYEAMVQCLKGPTLEGVRSLGENASVTDILNYLKGLFQGAAPFDTLLQNFFQLKQGESERVAKFAVRLESHLATLKWQYPEVLAPGYESKLKRDRLFYGLPKDIRDSIRTAYQNSKVPYADLLRAAREIEELGTSSQSSQSNGDSTAKQSKSKAKVASAIAPGLESTANLERLAAAAQKCHEEQRKAQETLKDSQKLMNDMIASIAAFKSPTFNFNPNQGQGKRGRGGFFRGRGNGRGGGNGRGRGQNQNEQNNQSNPPGSNGQNDQAQASGGIPRR